MNPTTSNLSSLTSDVHYSIHGGLFKPDYFTLYHKLLEIKNTSSHPKSNPLTNALPKDYQTAVLYHFIDFLDRQESDEFNDLFQKDMSRLTAKERFYRRIIPDISEALLQRDYEGAYYKSAHDDLLAFQAVVNSIYEVIVASNAFTISKTTLPPLAKWGKSKSPYTWTIMKTNKLGLKAGIVSLPSEHRNGGLLAWTTLGHEIAGHNFLCSRKELLPELENHVYNSVIRQSSIKDGDTKAKMASYWKGCVEEITSDILGVLNLGPIAAAALIGYLRGARGGGLKAEGIFPIERQTIANRAFMLSSHKKFDHLIRDVPNDIDLPNSHTFLGKVDNGSGDDKEELFFKPYFMDKDNHPVDILRPHVLANVIRKMNGKFASWADFVEEEAHKDDPATHTILLTNINASKPKPDEDLVEFNFAQAIEAGNFAAQAIIESPLICFEKSKICEIFSWTEREQMIADNFKPALSDVSRCQALTEVIRKGGLRKEITLLHENEFYARYIVAAATEIALCLSEEKRSQIEIIFTHMKALLTAAYRSSELTKKSRSIMQLDLPEDDSDLNPRYYF